MNFFFFKEHRPRSSSEEETREPFNLPARLFLRQRLVNSTSPTTSRKYSCEEYPGDNWADTKANSLRWTQIHPSNGDREHDHRILEETSRSRVHHRGKQPSGLPLEHISRKPAAKVIPAATLSTFVNSGKHHASILTIFLADLPIARTSVCCYGWACSLWCHGLGMSSTAAIGRMDMPRSHLPPSSSRRPFAFPSANASRLHRYLDTRRIPRSSTQCTAGNVS